MNWIKKGLLAAPEGKSVRVPLGLWVKCESCGEIIYKRELERTLHVCHKCGYHFRLSAHERIGITVDEGSFEEFDADIDPVDSLDFKDLKRYKDRLKSTQKKTRLRDAIVSGEGSINGRRVMLAVFDFSFMGGSMGSVVGEKITRMFEKALSTGCGAVVFSS